MNLESQIAVLLLAYTILSYSIHVIARYLKDLIVNVLSIATGIAMAYLCFNARGVAGLIGSMGVLTLIVSLLIAELYRVERRAMFSMLGVYFVGTSILLLITDSALRLFIYWEIIAMVMIGSLALYRSNDGYEAALKYAIICLPSSIVGLFGLILAISETGSLAFPELLLGAASLSKALMAIGFGAEIALFPMYVWLPSVYVGMHPLLLAVEVSSILPATSYIVGTIASMSPATALVISSLALIGSLVGSLSSIVQGDLRKLLSYSTLSQIGYIVLGLSAGTTLARSYSILQMIAHEIPKASLLLISFALLSRLKTSEVNSLSRLGGSYKFVVIGSALALLGLPPFLSFWSELYIFLGTFSAGTPWNILAIVYFTAIVLSTGYAFKIIYTYAEGAAESERIGTDAMGLLILLFFLLSILLSPLQSSILQYFLGFSP
ncbi:MAG: proton-conducting transporter membrane subunit [Fervidicoccaceae archaeon]